MPMTLPNIKKAYFEITNVCNLHCSFCPGTVRKKGFVDVESFRKTAEKLRGRISYLYLHLMGEPTVHPKLQQLLDIAYELGHKVIITTNGSTLAGKGRILLGSPAVYKISISLHSFEANDTEAPKMPEYLCNCFAFAKKAAEEGIICVLRLWNLRGNNTVGENELNPDILSEMKQYFTNEWTQTRSGMRLCDKVFLEYAEKFEWPTPQTDGKSTLDNDFFCHGLRDQIGILCDGTVVPCCLDSEGSVPLGNIFEQSLDEILGSTRAIEFYKALSARKCPSKLCQSCGYAERFVKKI